MNIQAVRDYLKTNKVAVECSNEQEWDEMKEVTGVVVSFRPEYPCMRYTGFGSRLHYESRGYTIIPFFRFKEMFTENDTPKVDTTEPTLQQALKAYNNAHFDGWGLLLEDDGSCALYNSETEEYHPEAFDTIEKCIKWLQDNTKKDPAEELINQIRPVEIHDEDKTPLVYAHQVKHLVEQWFKDNKGRTI